jgi:hypothetical protein
MRCFFVLGNLPHEDLIAPAIFPQKLLSGFLELFSIWAMVAASIGIVSYLFPVPPPSILFCVRTRCT